MKSFYQRIEIEQCKGWSRSKKSHTTTIATIIAATKVPTKPALAMSALDCTRLFKPSVDTCPATAEVTFAADAPPYVGTYPYPTFLDCVGVESTGATPTTMGTGAAGERGTLTGAAISTGEPYSMALGGAGEPYSTAGRMGATGIDADGVTAMGTAIEETQIMDEVGVGSCGGGVAKDAGEDVRVTITSSNSSHSCY
ncbi:hypothetical protein BC829DRAFT_381774, partial [Chytridium lagenaria]